MGRIRRRAGRRLARWESRLSAGARGRTRRVRLGIPRAHRGESTEQFVDSLGLQRGVSGYCLHTVPAALHAWLRHPEDCRAAVLAVIHCGGDTDTTGAIVGAITGAHVGVVGIPGDWLSGIVEWPRTMDRMRALAHQLADAIETNRAQTPPSVSFPGTLLRNGFFTAVAVVHVARRMLPPYY